MHRSKRQSNLQTVQAAEPSMSKGHRMLSGVEVQTQSVLIMIPRSMTFHTSVRLVFYRRFYCYL
jgi:hypothetical protein